ncbi:MAG: hypothetical protein FIA91_10270, partial [Geobacter sp.]|nr:hypothetical protein [Geobacter sp.]
RNNPIFNLTTAEIPLPNILATATAKDPIKRALHPTLGVYTTRLINKPMNPAEALAYVNTYEMGGTNAVAGVNAPIYIRFAAPVDATTVTAANIKVFQITPDVAGTENSPLGFTDVSGMFKYKYTAGSTDLFLEPNFPLLPATRYIYVVSNRVKDAANGLAIGSSQHFDALKSTTTLVGPLAALEAVRANVTASGNIKLSGYAKVMDDLIAASATTKVANRDEIALMGRFITTGAGFVSKDAIGTMMPVESALRAFALGTMPAGYPQGLPGKTWSNTVSSTTTIPAAAYWTAAGAPGSAPSTLASVVTGSIDSAELSIDPVVSRANASTMDLSSVTNAYNPSAGVAKAFRDSSGNLTGFYHSSRTIPFVYLVPTTPNGKVVIFQHGITGQKEQVLAVAQALTGQGYAVVAIDLPLHGALKVTGHTTGAVWGQDFMAVGAPLATRTNIQQAAFNLNRLEFALRFGGFATLGIVPPSPPASLDIKYVGVSLGSIVGSYYLAGNTTLATSGLPYTQTTLDSDMKGFLSVPGGRTAYLIQNSPAFSPSVIAGLAAVGIVKDSPTYNNFFQATQSVVDPADPATMTTPLASGLPSRLSGRIAIQEAVGDLVIPNENTRYLGNALGGREILGAAGATVAPGFKQLAYSGSGTHAAGIPSSFMLTLSGATPTPKTATASINATDTTPKEGYFQFDQTGVSHGFLLDPTNSAAATGYAQRQMVYFINTGLVVDPTYQNNTTLPKSLAAAVPAGLYREILLPKVVDILGY